MTTDIMVVTPATMVAPTMQEAIIVVDTIATAPTLDTVMVVVFAVLPSPAVGFTAPRSPTAGRYLTAAASAVAIIIKVSVASKWNLGTIDGRVAPEFRTHHAINQIGAMFLRWRRSVLSMETSLKNIIYGAECVCQERTA